MHDMMCTARRLSYDLGVAAAALGGYGRVDPAERVGDVEVKAEEENLRHSHRTPSRVCVAS